MFASKKLTGRLLLYVQVIGLKLEKTVSTKDVTTVDEQYVT